MKKYKVSTSLQIVRDNLRDNAYLHTQNLCDLSDVRQALYELQKLREEYGTHPDIDRRAATIAKLGVKMYQQLRNDPTQEQLFLQLYSTMSAHHIRSHREEAYIPTSRS